MRFARPAIALDPALFGRGPFWDLSPPASPPPLTLKLSDDFKLFATTFAAGFLVVSILIG